MPRVEGCLVCKQAKQRAAPVKQVQSVTSPATRPYEKIGFDHVEADDVSVGVNGMTTALIAADEFSNVISAQAGVTVASGQTLTVTGATVTGLTAASVGAGIFKSGNMTIQGNLTLHSFGVITVPESGPATPQFKDANNNGLFTVMTTNDEVGLSLLGLPLVHGFDNSGTQQLGFFGATPVSKPTGVAVSAAGVHAALVSLGLIAA